MKRRSVVKKIGISLGGLVWMSSYPESLLGNMRANGEGGPRVINAGVGGNNSIELLARLDKDCLSHRPELVVLMIGTNDMNSQKYVPPDAYRKNLVQLVTRTRSAGSALLLMTILPPYIPYLLTRHPEAFYQPEGVEGRRRQVNDVIQRVAREQRVHLLDIGRRFAAIGHIGTAADSLIRNPANAQMEDGVHPTPTGYRFIALSIYDYIQDHQLPVNKIVCFGDSITRGDGSIDKESYPAYLSALLGFSDQAN